MKATLEYDLDVQKEAKAFAAAQDVGKNQDKSDRKDRQDAKLAKLVLAVGKILENPNLPKPVREVVALIYEELKAI